MAVNKPAPSAKVRWLIVLLVLGAAAGWAVGWLVEGRSTPRGVVYGEPPPVELADHSLGVTVDLLGMSAEARRQFYEQAGPLGLRWVRLPVSWRAIDRGPGSYDWSTLDTIVGELDRQRANGLPVQILAVLTGVPDWTRNPQAPSDGQPPGDWRTFGAQFAREVAVRYRGRIVAYQIWDEPNLAANWFGRYPDPVGYARLLREAAIDIRDVDPGAKIISAALAPTTESGPLNLNEPEYLRQLYRAGAADFFDAAGAEPFGFWTGPDDRRVDAGVLNFSRLVLLREVMDANGDAHKAIWVTSFGWNVKGAADSPFGGDTAEVQSGRTLDAIQRARDEWPWLGPLVFARWTPEASDDPRAGFALLNGDGSPTSFLHALAAQATQRPVATTGRYDPADASAMYPRAWRVGHTGADIPVESSLPLTIAFRGTRFDLTLRRGDYEAFLFVTVDGLPADVLPRDEQGRSYVVLYDPLSQMADVTLARDLPDKDHVVEIVPQGGWGQWAIAGWTVAREREAATWPRLVGALVGAVAVVALLQLRRVRWRFPHPALPAATDRLALPAMFVAGALLYLSPSVLVSWALVALLALLVIWRLDAGLALVALAIPFYLQPKPLGVGSYAVVEIALLLCTVSFGIDRLWKRGKATGGRASVKRTALMPLDYVVVLWVLAGALGVLVAENFGVANRELRVVFVEPALYYGLIRATRADGRTLVNAFLLGALLVAGKALTDWVTRRDLITAEEGVLRVRSVYASPNNLALYLDRAAPLALCLALFGRSRRLLYALACALMLGALYLTFAKGAWLVALPAAFIMMVGVVVAWPGSAGQAQAAAGRRWVLLLVPLLLAALGLSLLPVLGTERVRSLFDLTAGTSFIRVQLWQSTLAMIRDHPFFGVGPDNFLYQYRTRYVLPSAFAEANLSHPHDILLDFWTRLGLVGVALLAALLVAFWRDALRLYRRLPDGDARALTLGLMASMVAALAHGLIDNSFFLVDLAFALMLTLAVVANGDS